MAQKKKAPQKRAPAKKSASAAVDELAREIERGTVQVVSKPASIAESFTAENVEKFILGKITWAELMGLSAEEAYGIAAYGYQLYEEGRFHDARTVFEPLVLANPYDGYFHNVLGAIYQQLDLRAEALSQYSMAIQVDEDAVHARINRGELYIQDGRFEEGLDDLEAALAQGKSSKDPAFERARALKQAATLVMKGLEALKKPAAKNK